MIIDSNKEVTFFHYIKNKPEYFQEIGLDFFKEPSIRCLYNIVKSFYVKFKKTISDDNIEIVLKNKKFKEFMVEDEIDKSINFNQKLFDTIMLEGQRKLDEQWSKLEFEGGAKWYYLMESIAKVVELSNNEITTHENIDEFRSQIKDIIIQGTSINFYEDLGSDIRDAKSHQSISRKRFTTGYKYFDECLDGGFCEGELVCIAGPAKGGKSMFMSNLAKNQVLNGKNVVIITLEMLEFAYNERVARNLLSLNKEEYRSQIGDTEIFQNVLDKFFRRNISKELGKIQNPGELYIKFMPASTATIPMIESYVNRLEDHINKKFDLVVLDYINLCSNWKNTKSEDMYNKIKALSIDFRDMLNRKKCAGLTGTQLNREGAISEKIHEGSISESHALIANVDAMFSIKKRTNNDVQKGEIRMVHLASRNGAKQDGNYRFEVNFDYFKVTEKGKQDIIEEDFNIDDISDNDAIFTFGM